MSRYSRAWRPGFGAHIISRFVDWRFYLITKKDRKLFQRCITEATRRWDWQWLSFALMSSHIHYGLVSGAIPPEHFFRSAHTRFAQSYHRRTQLRTLGPVFADRPDLYDISPRQLAHMVAYHHRNPVKAGIVQRPRDSTWTSHRIYLRLEPAPPWLDVEWALSMLGFDDTQAGRTHFDQFVTEHDDYIPEAGDAFQSGQQDRDNAERIKAPLPSLQSENIPWQKIGDCARLVAGVSPDAPLEASNHRTAVARRIFALIAIEDYYQTYQSIGRQLRIRPASVGNLLNRPVPRSKQSLQELATKARQALSAI